MALDARSFDFEIPESPMRSEHDSRRCARQKRTGEALLAKTAVMAVQTFVISVFCLITSGSPSAAAVTDLLVVESGQDTVLTWSTGVPPFRVLRSESPNFYFGNHLVAQGLGTGTVTDVGALEPGDPSYFYLVLEGGDANPPGWEANPPRPVPFLTSLTPDFGSPGDVVTIDGGSFEPEGAAMTVEFQNAIDSAEILTASDTQLTVVVPDDALTGDVFVCWAGQCSNRLPFKVVFASGFEDISSIAFEPGTGSLWVADRGLADDLLEIEANGTIQVRPATLQEPVVGHPSPGDGTGRVHYCNSSSAVPNAGNMRYINSATNTDHFFAFAGTGGTDNVRCEGIAANDLEPSFAYLLNGVDNTIRRVFQGGNHDPMYGDQPFPFNSPSGARFDSEGNLYVSATTSIFKILPLEAGVELVASGFTAAAGIDLSERSGIPMLLVADEATGNIWLVNAETGEKEIVDAEFAGPVGVAFTEDPITGDLFYDVAEPTRILRLPDPVAEFEEKVDTRVLLSRRGLEQSWPSSNQVGDRTIRVRVKVTDKVDPVGTTVYFRIIDPKDPSLYLNGQSGDNLPASPAGTVTPSAVVDATGHAEVILEVGPQYVGNNYKVEAGFTAPPNFKKAAISKEYSTWRRLYIEHDKMLKEGSFLTQTSGAGQANPARVFVASSANFAIGEDVLILSGESNDHAAGETGMIAAVEPIPGCGCVDLQSPLQRSYAEPIDPPTIQYPHSFLAKRTAGAFDVAPVATSLARAFEDGFTEWYFQPGGFVPRWDPSNVPELERKQYIEDRSFWFFASFNRPLSEPLVNHAQLVSANRYEPAQPPPAQAKLGLTFADNTNQVASNWSWIFDERIVDDATPGNVQNVRDHVIAHELGHQLNVNDGDPDGHDMQQGWSPPGQPTLSCLMRAETAPNTTANHRFHANQGAPTRDLLCIRTHVDDLNQNTCP